MACGILVIDKPAGWTSMDVCAKLRGAFRERRVGHGGTLDPMATGVLPVFLGRATRAASFAEDSRKEYEGVLRLGVETDTQDITGTVTAEHPVRVSEAEVTAALAAFQGTIEQIPPMYSAVKIQGKKLYTMARKGQEVPRPPRRITIYRIELLGRTGEADYRFRCLCSKGTYIRTLCHDVGRSLGCGGVLAELRRTMAAGFREADAVPLAAALEDGAALLRPVDSLFAGHPALTLPAGAERRVRCGHPVRTGAADGVYRVYGGDGAFLCLSRAENGTLTSLKNFFGE